MIGGVSRALVVGVLSFVTASTAGPATAAAQTSEVSVEIGGSRVVPPSEVEGDAAGFLVGGLRASRYGFGGSGVHASLLLGRALDAATGGDFLSAEVGGRAWRALGRGWSTGGEARAFGFRVRDPFAYRAAGAEGSALLRYRGHVWSGRLAATGGVGRSRVDVSTVVQRLRRRATVVEVLTDDLWRWGATAELLAGGGPVAAGVAATVHRTAGGTYRSAGVRIVAGGARGALELRLDGWHTPEGRETSGGVAFYLPWGGWSARGMAGRPEPDPLLMAEPGRGAQGMLLGRRLVGSGPAPTSGTPLYQVRDVTPASARVRIRVEAPPGAQAVQVLGDFTLWKPVEMEADGRWWVTEMDVPAGTYHFGFLVDGRWYLPNDAPDAVPDEWGRQSATLVVEGERGAGGP